MKVLVKPLLYAAPLAAMSSGAVAQPTDGPADCRLELTIDNNVDWRGLYGRGYDVFGSDKSYEVVTVTVRHEGEACDYFVTGISQGGGNESYLNGPYGRLQYDVLQQPSGPSVLSPDFTGNRFSRIYGRFPGGVGVQQFVLYVSIPPEQNVGGGVYSDQVLVRAFTDGLSSPELMDEATFAVYAPVADTLQVESVDAGPGADSLNVDLGNLSPGVERTLDFRLRSNAPVRVGASSRHHGFLAHQASAPGIPYRLVIGGSRIDLASDGPTQAVSGDLSAHTTVPLIIAVDPQDGAAAGTYSDVLTITFQVDR